MSRITRFLCYFLSLKLASVLFYYAFPSLRESEREQKVRHWEARKERRVKENEIETDRPRRKVQAPDYYSSRRKQGR